MKNNSTSKINKEQILFLFSAITGIILFYFSYESSKIESYSVSTTSETQNSENKTAPLFISQLFPQKSFSPYWTEGRLIFRKVDYLKKMPPIQMEVPKITNFETIFLPPLPHPNAQFLHSYPVAPFQVVEKAISIPDPKKLVPEIAPTKYSRLAQIIQKKVYTKDVVIMNNGKRFEGKIINENSNEIILHVESNGKFINYDLLKGQIQKVYKAININQVCKLEFKKFSSLSTKKRILLAQAFADLKQHDLAKETFISCIKAAPNNEEAYLLFIEYLLSRFEYDEAIHWLYKANEHISNSREIEMKYLLLFQKFEFYYSEKKILDTLNSQEELIHKAKLALKNNNYLESGKYIDEFLSNSTSKNRQDEAKYWKAHILFAQNRLDDSLELCMQIEKQSYWFIKSQNLKGCIYYLKGDLAEAVNILFENANNGDILSWYNLALVYFATNATSEAISTLETLTQEVFSSQYQEFIWSALAFFVYQQNNADKDKALSVLDNAVKANPNSFIAHYIAGEIHKKDNTIKAYEHYQKSIQSNFEFIPSFVRLAEITYLSNNYEDSQKYLFEIKKRTNVLSAKDLSRINSLITHIYLANNNKEAHKVLQESLQTYDTVHTLKLAAVIANNDGETDLSLTYLQRVLNISPGDSYAQKYKDAITLNQNSVYWEDSFSRRNNENVHRGWLEEESNGVTIQLRDSQVFFSGIQRRDDATQVSKKVSYKNFLSFSGDVISTARAYIGIFITDGITYHYLGKDKDNILGFGTDLNEKWKKIEDSKWPETPACKLELQRSPQQGTYRFIVNDKIILDDVKLKLNKNELRLGFFGKASLSVPWSAHVDNVRIVEKK